MQKLILTFFILIFFSVPYIYAQVPNVDPDIIRQELEKRGLDENEVLNRLEQKGIDINNITPENMNEVQKAIEETVAELEKENQTAAKEAAEIAADKAATEMAEEKLKICIKHSTSHFYINRCGTNPAN